jgi:hypothetical protein
MKHTLPPAALEVAISWLRTRADDPQDDGDEHAAKWLTALEAGNGTADLPAQAWRLIADDLLAEADKDYTARQRSAALVASTDKIYSDLADA